MAGAGGHRVVTPRRRKEEHLTHARILDHCRRHTKLASDDELHAKLLRDTDTWLTADEAVALGVADVVEKRGD